MLNVHLINANPSWPTSATKGIGQKKENLPETASSTTYEG